VSKRYGKPEETIAMCGDLLAAPAAFEVAVTLQLNDETQRVLSLVEAEIDTIFDLAKRASADAQGMPDANVD
jgi:hypothetical protein